MPENLAYLLVLVVLAWLTLLSVMFWRLFAHYNKLSHGAGEKGLKALLEELLEENKENKKDIEKLTRYCDRIEKDGNFHIQKVGLLRYNPFKDTGGDQSFILSLVDKTDTGVIISGLYSRSGLRWYAKKVEKGKGVEHKLSDEELKALNQASKK